MILSKSLMSDSKIKLFISMIGQEVKGIEAENSFQIEAGQLGLMEELGFRDWGVVSHFFSTQMVSEITYHYNGQTHRKVVSNNDLLLFLHEEGELIEFDVRKNKVTFASWTNGRNGMIDTYPEITITRFFEMVRDTNRLYNLINGFVKEFILKTNHNKAA